MASEGDASSRAAGRQAAGGRCSPSALSRPQYQSRLRRVTGVASVPRGALGAWGAPDRASSLAGHEARREEGFHPRAKGGFLWLGDLVRRETFSGNSCEASPEASLVREEGRLPLEGRPLWAEGRLLWSEGGSLRRDERRKARLLSIGVIP